MNGPDRVGTEQARGVVMFHYGTGSRVALASLIRWLDERLRYRVPGVAVQRLPAEDP